MGAKRSPDFSGYATKNGLKCSDGRTILAGAFAHQDKQRVPLVWQHRHNEVANILGHAELEHRSDGVYAYAYFNDTEDAQKAKAAVLHGDITALSIYANQLKETSKIVQHGAIREVSLVIAGANPGAFIDHINIRHGDEIVELDDEAIIYTGLTFQHSVEEELEEQTEEKIVEDTNPSGKPAEESTAVTHADNNEGAPVAEDTKTESKGRTLKDIYDTLNKEQLALLHYMLGEAVEQEAAEHDALGDNNAIQHQEGTPMPRNVFEGAEGGTSARAHLSHDQISTIVNDAARHGSLKESVLYHAEDYGITNIDLLFPDAKALDSSPQMLARQTDWVVKVLQGVKSSPVAKVKSLVADLTPEQARARGYIKGNLKKDEVISLMRRTTSPTTIYKKQKLDRDDILDITDFDVITWLKAEMRLMLNEEIARAILVGDGRSVASEDKIKDPIGATDGIGIRSIANDHDLYAHRVQLPANTTAQTKIKEIGAARSKYRGSGTPTLFTSDAELTAMLQLEDRVGRRLYETEAALAAVLRVKEIVAVEVMEDTPDLLGIIVNLQDYTVGANRGGELTFFDDFDIDFNQNKYLLETRVSGGLTKLKSAIVIRRDTGIEATATSPSFNGTTNTITIPTVTGVAYLINDVVVTGSVVITEPTTVTAEATEGYFLAPGSTTEWAYSPTAA